MGAVSETIVREFFELHGFFIRQRRKYIPHNKREEEEIDFFVLNPEPHVMDEALPFVLSAADVRSVERAVVVVKGWHTENFTSSLLTSAPEILRFVEPKIFQRAAKVFGETKPPAKILVVPSLPTGEEARRESIDLLRCKGVDAVILFRTMLAELIERIEVNRNYAKSDLLQIVRILKNYDFFRGPQLELFKGGRRKGASEAPKGER